MHISISLIIIFAKEYVYFDYKNHFNQFNPINIYIKYFYILYLYKLSHNISYTVSHINILIQ